jgi:hypothetical protein
VIRNRLNLDPAMSALERMDSYEDLRADDYFTAGEGELCFSCEEGRLVLLSELANELGFSVKDGQGFLPDQDNVQTTLVREGSFGDEIAHIVEENLPFYRRGYQALLKGLAIRLCVLIVLLIAGRLFFLAKSDHFTVRSFPAILHTLEIEYLPQNLLERFWKPAYSHRSLITLKHPLYIRGNKLILDGGYFVQLEGVQNLKASIEKRGDAPVSIRVDSREGKMRIASVHVGEDLLTHKGELKYLSRIPLSPLPLRLDPTSERVGYKKVSSADPKQEESFSWMLGKTISMICHVESDGDRFLASGADGEFKFAFVKDDIKENIREIIEMVVASGERAILDIRLESKAYPLRNRRNPRNQRRDLNIITGASLHFAQVQSAVMKNL